MSWAIVERVFNTKMDGGGGAAKAVLLSLANHCDERGGSCFPGQELIQVETGLSLDTIQRQLPVLEKGGWIKRKKRSGVKGRWWSWEYHIKLEKLAKLPVQAAPCGLDKNDQAAPCGFTRPQGAVSPGRTMRLEPVIEPVIEPSRARDTDDRGPRQRADALGPLADRESELRSLLGERFRVLAMGKVIELTPDGELVISVLTANHGNLIRRDCEADLLAVSGASQLRFIIELPCEPPRLRRMPT